MRTTVRPVVPVIALGLVQNFTVGWVLHFVYLPGAGDLHLSLGAFGNHSEHGAPAAPEQTLSPLAHYLRDSSLAAPVAVVVLLVTTHLVRRLLASRSTTPDSLAARLIFAVAAALAAGLASVPEVLAHGWLFDEHVVGTSLASHVTGVALVTLRYTFALTLGWAMLFGVPWRVPNHPTPIIARQPGH